MHHQMRVNWMNVLIVVYLTDLDCLSDPPESFNPYNKLGTLVVWNGLEPLVLNGHSRQGKFGFRLFVTNL